MTQSLLISLLSGLATGIGGIIVLWFGQPTKAVLSFYLGISAGMMGMVVLVDLFPASLNYGSVLYSIIGTLIGILVMYLNNKFYRNMGYFMTLAIALHNIPEGLAIGAGFENDHELGTRLALVIALHNIPEGLGLASTLFLSQIPRFFIILLPFFTGLFIPLGTWISLILDNMISDWISIGLGIASGAMGYLVIKEIGPESIKLNRLLGQFGIAVGIMILYLVYRLNG